MNRDRDPAGRPRNARPRDALGRPLPRDAAADPDQARIPDDLLLDPADAVRLADELLRAGRPFHAHEVLEASWKSGPPAERDLWQGLAQIAVGLTHAQRGNARGAIVLLRRGLARVLHYEGSSYGLDIPAICSLADGLASRIERDGLTRIPAADLRPGLVAPGSANRD
jgi:uncharacterized protein